MKSPLMYQLTEDSCGEVATFNCISYLFDREAMPLELLHMLSSYTIGCCDEEGNFTNKEFCDNFLYFVSSWIAGYAKEKHIPLKAQYLTGDDVNLLSIRRCLMAGGCVNLKTIRRGKHFVTITGMDDEDMFIFDPYYKAEGSYRPQQGIEIVNDRPFEYNRKVRIEKFIEEQKSELVLGEKAGREAILFYKNDAILQREFV